MANQEHLDILKQGVGVWNKWRKNNPGLTPDLTSAGLSGFDFLGIDLTGSDLKRISLEKSNLVGAIFTKADLRDLENTDIPIIISSYCNVKTGELAYEDICTEPQRHNS